MLRCTLDALARRRNAELDEDLETNPRRDDVSLLRIRVWGSLRVVDDSCDACLLYVALQCVHMGNKEDYRSRTWCLSSGFRLGLRAKVAVI